MKGAFTDARTDRIGRFELADNGTIFLDEIGNVPMRQQAKLLRVLETGEIERVGSSRTKRINVRVISATNTDLQAAIAAGQFPRRPAVPAEHGRDSMSRRCANAAKTFPRLPRTSFALCCALSRSGDRLRRARPAGDDAICLAGQRSRAGAHAGARRADVPDGRDSSLRPRAECAARPQGQNLEELSIEEVEGILVRKALQRFHGNVSQAAEALGLSRGALYRRMERMDSSSPSSGKARIAQRSAANEFASSTKNASPLRVCSLPSRRSLVCGISHLDAATGRSESKIALTFAVLFVWWF